MSIAENIKTAEEHLEAESKRELDRLLGTLAEECVYEENLLKRSVRGKEEVAQYYEELWQAFPDVTYVVTNRVADEACVIYELRRNGEESITSNSWVCRTRQNVTFRDSNPQPIRNQLRGG